MAVRLSATTGRPTGSRPSSRLRGEGQVPAVLYGLGAASVPVTVPWTELRRVLSTDAGMNALIDLEVDGDVSLTIVKDLQRHPVRRDVLHVDFLRLDPDVDILVEVPIHLVGEPEAVTKAHALVEQMLHHLPILVRPIDIPDEVTVDISELTLGTAITVSQIVLPAGARTEVAGDESVAVAYVPRRLAVAGEGDEAGAEGEGEGGGGDGEEAAAQDGSVDADGGADGAAADDASD